MFLLFNTTTSKNYVMVDIIARLSPKKLHQRYPTTHQAAMVSG
jgi:hypothetical protein